jgi:hypothetical protein
MDTSLSSCLCVTGTRCVNISNFGNAGRRCFFHGQPTATIPLQFCEEYVNRYLHANVIGRISRPTRVAEKKFEQ